MGRQADRRGQSWRAITAWRIRPRWREVCGSSGAATSPPGGVIIAAKKPSPAPVAAAPQPCALEGACRQALVGPGKKTPARRKATWQGRRKEAAPKARTKLQGCCSKGQPDRAGGQGADQRTWRRIGYPVRLGRTPPIVDSSGWQPYGRSLRLKQGSPTGRRWKEAASAGLYGEPQRANPPVKPAARAGDQACGASQLKPC